MNAEFLTFLLILIVAPIPFVVFYLIIKIAVRNGIIEAKKKLEQDNDESS